MSTQQNAEVISVSNVFKSFQVGKQQVQILKDVSLKVHRGDFLVIFGPSGCGKSTLLHVLLGLEKPTKGEITIDGHKLYTYNEDQIADFRKEHVGMVYQQPHWIKSLTVVENIAFPLTLMQIDEKTRLEKARELLKMVKMEEWADYLPSELSSGQQQRISLARALISNPDFIIADEPTGNLDFESGVQLMQLLGNINATTNKTVLMVTHDLEYMKYAKTAVRMLDGQIVEIIDDTKSTAFTAHIKSKRGEGTHEASK